MNADKEIRLRLRFYKDVSKNIDAVRQKFEKASQNKYDSFKLKVAENHIWMYIIGDKKEYWSPHTGHSMKEEHSKWLKELQP